MSRYRAAVVRAPVDEIATAVREGIALMGGIERYVRPGAEVVIKVNMFSAGAPESGLTTHPAVAREVARLCHACGANVTVVERVAKYDVDFAGYEDVADVASLVNLDDAPHTLKHLAGARSLLCQVPWPDLLDRCDVFINIPGLRTHALTKLSNGMKNLMGLMPRESTRLVHHYGLDGSICDLNVHRPSDLVITEAVWGLNGNFPSEGSPVKSEFVAVSDNVVVADLIGARAWGVDPSELFYLQEAIERGMGPADLDQVELLGDDLDEIAGGLDIEQAPRDPELYCGQHRLLIRHATTPVRQALAGGLLAASHRSEVADMPSVTIVAGPQDESLGLDQELAGQKVLLYGNETYRYRHLGHYEPGEPPLAYQVVRGLLALQTGTIRPSMCSIAWKNEPIESIVPIVAEAGYAGIEAWGPHCDRYVKEHGSLDELVEQIEVYGLAVPMVSTYFDLVGDPEGSLVTAERMLDHATALGALLLRVFTGGGNSDDATIATWRAVTTRLRVLCEMAAARGISCALETHAGHLHNTTASTLRLIRQTAMPNLVVNLDIYNLYERGEDPVGALKQLLPHLAILHFKNRAHVDGDWVTRSLATGDMDYEPFLRALAVSKYHGYASIEWFGEASERAARTEIAYLHRQLGDRLEGHHE